MVTWATLFFCLFVVHAPCTMASLVCCKGSAAGRQIFGARHGVCNAAKHCACTFANEGHDPVGKIEVISMTIDVKCRLLNICPSVLYTV